MTPLVDRVAAVVARHSPITGLGFSRGRCGCGELFPAPFIKSHAHHSAVPIVAVLADVDEWAKALWAAENPHWNRGDPYGEWVPWAWADADEEAREVRRATARAVMQHLGFTSVDVEDSP